MIKIYNKKYWLELSRFSILGAYTFTKYKYLQIQKTIVKKIKLTKY